MNDKPAEQPIQPSAPPTLEELSSQRSQTATAIAALLSNESIQDPEDRMALSAASEFLKSPTRELSEIAKHASDVGQIVCMSYEMMDLPVPPEIDAMHHQLQILHCQYHIASVEAELARSPADPEIIKHSLAQALSDAKIIAKGYRDETWLKEVQAMEQRAIAS